MSAGELGELSDYLSSRLGSTTVSSAKRAFPGHSRATWVLDTVEQGGLVLRVDHPGGPLVPVPMALEYAVYDKLWGTEVPVAEPLFCAEGTTFADGRAHMVRRLVTGSSKVAGLTGRASDDPGLRRAVCYEMAEKLAIVHKLDWAAVGLGEILFVPSTPSTAFGEEVQRWRGLWMNSRSGVFPMLLEATYWLEENVPDGEARLCLTKGNNGVGEEIWRDGRIVALSDWELASVGDPSLDWAFSQGLLALNDPADTLAHYAEHGGYAIPPELLAWSVVWIQLKASMTTNGGLAAFVSGADNRMVRPALGLGHIKRTEAWLSSALGRDVTEVGLELLANVRSSYLER